MLPVTVACNVDMTAFPATHHCHASAAMQVANTEHSMGQAALHSSAIFKTTLM